MNYSQIVSVLVSSYTLVAISVERYVGVFYPFRPKMTLRQVLSVVLITWILSLCVSLPAVIFSETIDYQYSEDPSFKVTLCMEKWPPFEDDGFYSYIYGMVLMVLQVWLIFLNGSHSALKPQKRRCPSVITSLPWQRWQPSQDLRASSELASYTCDASTASERICSPSQKSLT